MNNFYDDLASSGNFNPNFKQQFHFEPTANALEDSVRNSMDFNPSQMDLNAKQRDNAYDNFLLNERQDLKAKQYFEAQTPPEHQYQQQQFYSKQHDIPSQNYTKFNQLLQMTSDTKNQFDDYSNNDFIYKDHKKVLLEQQQYSPELQDSGKSANGFERNDLVKQSQQLELNLNQAQQVNQEIGLLLEQFKRQQPVSQLQQQQQPMYQQQPLYPQNVQYQPAYSQYQGPSFKDLNQENSLLVIAQHRNQNPSSSNNSAAEDNFQSQGDNDDSSDYHQNQSFQNNNFAQYQEKSQIASKQQQQTNELPMPNPNTNNNQFGGGFQKNMMFGDGGQNNNFQSFNQQPPPFLFSQKMQQPFQKVNEKENSNFNNVGQKKQLAQQPLKRAQTEQEQRKAELMKQFDDIPIKEFHKQITNEDAKQDDEASNDEKEKAPEKMTLEDRLEHKQWQIRKQAYIDLEQLFRDYYQGNAEEDLINPYEQYSSKLEKMIVDQNLTAQQDGLACLLVYLKCSPDIKEVAFSCHSILIEKVQHNKAKVAKIAIQILLEMIKKSGKELLTSIIKYLKYQKEVKENANANENIKTQMKDKSFKIAEFCIDVLQAYLEKNALNVESSVLKMILNNLQQALTSSSSGNGTLRGNAIKLLQTIYSQIADDAQTLLVSIKLQLRPIQLKELLDLISQVDKMPSNQQLISLFSKEDQANASKQIAKMLQKNESDVIVDKKKDLDKPERAQTDTDLANLVPKNFFEIPYLGQISVKKQAMESFNLEMEQLVGQKNAQIAQKDYSNIFNVVTHLLEDSNVLVYSEAIKSVEFLAILLNRSMKLAKLKHFIQLLTEKYKETKNVVITLINKAISTIIESDCISLPQLLEYLILGLAFPNKNPRVKQMILEKAQNILQLDELKEEEAIVLFRLVKDKLVNFIQKDTNAGVRDAAISVIIEFKRIIPNEQAVLETINSLPKYRIVEINKKILDFQNTNTSKPQSKLKKKDQASSNLDNDFSYQGREISGQYQIHIADIVLSLKKIAQSKMTITAEQLKLKWEESIEKLGEMGVKEGKPVVVSCVYWLLTNYISVFGMQPSNQQYLETISHLIKTMYCIERSVEKNQNTFQSLELTQALTIGNIIYILSQSNKRLVEPIYNVMFSAASPFIQATFVYSLRDILQKLDTVPFKQVQINEELASAQIINFMFGWIGDKVKLLMQKGVQVMQLEDLRGLALEYLQKFENEDAKEVIIATQLRFKEILEHQMSPTNDSIQVNKLVEKQDSRRQTKQSFEQPVQQKAEQQLKQEEVKSQTQQVLEILDTDFDQGMQMIKALSLSEEMLQYSNKEKVAQKLIKITVNIPQKMVKTQQNQQQFYQASLALRALIYLKTEVFGQEDTFKLCPLVLDVYLKSQQSEQSTFQSSDSSVELYLLNNWTKDLSLRDIIDRIVISIKQFDQQKLQNHSFTILFKWLLDQRLNGSSQTEFQIEDLRKACPYIARNISNIDIKDFISQCVENFGLKKVREFMEIQLMHSQSDFNNFMDWFNIKYRHQKDGDEQLQEASSFKERQQDNIRFPDIDVKNVEQRTNESEPKKPKIKQVQDIELAAALQVNTSQYDSLNIQAPLSSRAQDKNNANQCIKSYQHMRQKRKTSNQKKQQLRQDDEISQIEQSNNKYESILQKLEEQLHSVPTLQLKNMQQNASSEEEKYFQMEEQSKPNTGYGQAQSRLNSKQDKRLRYEEQKQKSVSPQQSEDDHENDEDRSRSGSPTERDNNMVDMSSEKYQQKESNIVKFLSYSEKPQQQLNTNQKKADMLRDSAQTFEDAQEKLMQSQFKENRFREDMESLVQHKERLEQERIHLMKENNKETVEWRNKFEQMREEHDDVVESLSEANKCYLLQVNENEDLKKQLKMMQDQHTMMMKRFEDIEKKIASKDAQSKVKQQLDQSIKDYEDSLQQNSPVAKPSKTNIVKEENLKKIEQIFNNSNSQVASRTQSQSEIGIKKVQELLLCTESKEHNEELGQSLTVYYSKMRIFQEKLTMVKGISSSLESEDVLYALPMPAYITLLRFLLHAFSLEKSLLERQSISQSIGQKTSTGNDQNEITLEVQKLVSKLLNSKEFTTTLVSLFQILRDAMPGDMYVELKDVDQQFLKVLMRCISRITKALHSENPDLIRAFDVLIEMQKIFAKHPPECLRENMPSLQDFDYVYRTLKDVSDKLMELQPEKVNVFLRFIDTKSEASDEKSILRKQNAFIHYMRSVMKTKEQQQQREQDGDEDEEGEGDYGQYDQDEDN